MSAIKYRAGYKFQLAADWSVQTEITGFNVSDAFIRLAPGGMLTVRDGYAWDGPSGPTWDTPDFMRGSLAHDALYQLMRKGLLPQSCRKPADLLLAELCRQDGMGRIRRWYILRSLRAFAAFAARRQCEKILTAP